MDALLKVLADRAALDHLDRPSLIELRRQAAYLIADVDAALSTAQRDSEQAPKAEDRLLEVPAAARMLGVPATYLYQLIRQERFPAVKVGKYVRVRASDVERAKQTGLTGMIPARPKRALDKGQTIRLP